MKLTKLQIRTLIALRDGTSWPGNNRRAFNVLIKLGLVKESLFDRYTPFTLTEYGKDIARSL